MTTKKVDLYELLRVERTAAPGEIRKAYLALAKKCHPDKLIQQGTGPDLGEAFKALKKAYDVLSDPQRRERYDRTGVVDDEDSQSFQDAYEAFRGIKVTKEDIERFEAAYRNSPEEEKDLIEFFEAHQGDVRNALAYIIGSTNEDRQRYIQFWESKLKSGELTKKFAKEFHAAKGEMKTLEELDGEEEDIGEDDDDDMEEDDEDEAEEDDDDDDEEEEEDDGFIVSDEVDDEEAYESSSGEDDQAEGALMFTPGDLVQVRWKSGKTWYDAYILGVHKKDRTFDVEYVRGKEKENGVPASLVRSKPVEEKQPAKKSKSSKAGSQDDIDPALLAAFAKRDQERQQAFAEFEAKYTGRQNKKKG